MLRTNGYMLRTIKCLFTILLVVLVVTSMRTNIELRQEIELLNNVIDDMEIDMSALKIKADKYLKMLEKDSR